jgi:hypothetical protein
MLRPEVGDYLQVGVPGFRPSPERWWGLGEISAAGRCRTRPHCAAGDMGNTLDRAHR